MGASTLIRLASGLFTFAIMARVLGPSTFGILMLWLSIATLIALIANYGFTPYALREIGADQSSATKVMSEVLSAKALVGSILIIFSFIASTLIASSERWIFIVLLLAMLVDSMTDFLNVGYRATNRFSTETRIATISSIIQFSTVALTSYLLRDIFWIAGSFLVSRLIVLAATWLSQRQYFSNLRFSSYRNAIWRLREAGSYAFDFGLQSLFGQIDNLALNQFAGPAAIGIYQSGMRIFLAGSQAAAIVGNVLIPHAASFTNDLQAKRRVNGNLVTTLLTIGMVGGLVFALIPKSLVIYVFGANFVNLSDLLFGFGLLFFARFTAAAIGTVLTIQGFQKERAVCTFLHWIFIAAYCYFFPINNTLNWISALIFGHDALIIFYAIVLRVRSFNSISVSSWIKIIVGAIGINIVTICWIN